MRAGQSKPLRMPRQDKQVKWGCLNVIWLMMLHGLFVYFSLAASIWARRYSLYPVHHALCVMYVMCCCLSDALNQNSIYFHVRVRTLAPTQVLFSHVSASVLCFCGALTDSASGETTFSKLSNMKSFQRPKHAWAQFCEHDLGAKAVKASGH